MDRLELPFLFYKNIWLIHDVLAAAKLERARRGLSGIARQSDAGSFSAMTWQIRNFPLKAHVEIS
jgi:hypothetical protein